MSDNSRGSGASPLSSGRPAYRLDRTTLTSLFSTAVCAVILLLPLLAYADEHAQNLVYRSPTELMPKASVILHTPFDLARGSDWLAALGVVFLYLPLPLTLLLGLAILFGSHRGIRLDVDGKRQGGAVPVERVSRREFTAARKGERAPFVYPGLCWTMFLITVAVWLTELIMYIYGAVNLGIDSNRISSEVRPGMYVFGVVILAGLLLALAAWPTRGLALTVHEPGQASVVSMRDREGREFPPESGHAA